MFICLLSFLLIFSLFILSWIFCIAFFTLLEVFVLICAYAMCVTCAGTPPGPLMPTVRRYAFRLEYLQRSDRSCCVRMPHFCCCDALLLIGAHSRSLMSKYLSLVAFACVRVYAWHLYVNFMRHILAAAFVYELIHLFIFILIIFKPTAAAYLCMNINTFYFYCSYAAA